MYNEKSRANLVLITKENASDMGRRGGIAKAIACAAMKKTEAEYKVMLSKLSQREKEFYVSAFFDLSKQRQDFLLAFFSSGGNASAAAKQAGYSKRYPQQAGYRLLRNKNVYAGWQALKKYYGMM